MIVKLQRPQTGEPRWVMMGPPGFVLDYIEPTPTLTRRMETEVGYFDAKKLKRGWEIGDRVPDQLW
jgi:hypothetical protein